MDKYTTEQVQALGFRLVVQRDQAIEGIKEVVAELHKRAQAKPMQESTKPMQEVPVEIEVVKEGEGTTA